MKKNLKRVPVHLQTYQSVNTSKYGKFIKNNSVAKHQHEVFSSALVHVVDQSLVLLVDEESLELERRSQLPAGLGELVGEDAEGLDLTK